MPETEQTTETTSEQTLLTETPQQTEQQTEPSLVNKDVKPEGAPEAYAAYTLPEGIELAEATVKDFNTIAKELNIPQAGAQKLVDFYVKQMQEAEQAPFEFYKEQRTEWKKTITSDPNLGTGTDLKPQVKTTISKFIDSFGPGLAKDFREAMNFTGAGDHPAFIRAFYNIAQKFTEGSLVPGTKPSQNGQTAPNAQTATGASAMYPNLPA